MTTIELGPVVGEEFSDEELGMTDEDYVQLTDEEWAERLAEDDIDALPKDEREKLLTAGLLELTYRLDFDPEQFGPENVERIRRGAERLLARFTAEVDVEHVIVCAIRVEKTDSPEARERKLKIGRLLAEIQALEQIGKEEPEPECDCEVCTQGGDCCEEPFATTIAELLAGAYNHGGGVSPKNQTLALYAAGEVLSEMATSSTETANAELVTEICGEILEELSPASRGE